MKRRLVLFAVMALGGCQCLQPVDEDAGAQFDAGPTDAGHDAGAATGCLRPSDCTGTPHVVSWCGTILRGDAGFSCVDQQCVAQCGDSAGQTCAQDPGVECLRCPVASSCIPPSCGGGYDFTFQVVEFACRGASPLGLGDRIRETPGDGGCGVPLFLEVDGGEVLFGQLFLQSARGLSARIDALGGTCLVSELPTGAPRLLLDCPRCQVALGP